jgi:GH35 family endo-1,4-beta-xylanase
VARSAHPARTLRDLMTARVRKVVGRYRAEIAIWDVVNEPLALFGAGSDETDSPATRANLFHETLGERYIDLAFRAAHAADPRARLFLNELVWNPAVGDAKADALVALVRRLKRRGVPIDGVGIQTHGMFGVAPPWFPESKAGFARYLRALAPRRPPPTGGSPRPARPCVPAPASPSGGCATRTRGSTQTR